jgi:hypothetical protein
MWRRTTEAKDNKKQSLVGFGLFGGLIVFICGGILTWVLAMGSVFRATYTRDPLTDAVNDIGVGVHIPWGVLVMTLGALSMLASIGYGFLHMKGSKKGPRQILQGVRVIARFATDKTGILYTEPGQMEFIDGLKYYVRILSPTEGSVEFESIEDVFWTCGEGMTGEAEVQGRWIGRFVPYADQQVGRI